MNTWGPRSSSGPMRIMPMPRGRMPARWVYTWLMLAMRLATRQERQLVRPTEQLVLTRIRGDLVAKLVAELGGL